MWNRCEKKIAALRGGKMWNRCEAMGNRCEIEPDFDVKIVVISMCNGCERDMKSFYSSIKHPGQLFNKHFIDTLSALFPKIIIGKEPLKLAQEHLLLHHQHVVEPKSNDGFVERADVTDACTNAPEIKWKTKHLNHAIYDPINLEKYLDSTEYLKF